MAVPIQTTRIIVSSVIAAGFIAAAFVLSSPHGPSVANALSSEELLREYAAKDTDSDGLLDWQEELYGTDPADPSSVEAGMTDREAVDAGKIAPRAPAEVPTNVKVDVPGVDAAPDTLTDRFTRELFGNYLLARGAEVPSEKELLSFIEDAAADLRADTAVRQKYLATDIARGSLTTDAYMLDAGRALSPEYAYGKDKDELDYFSEAVSGGKTASYARVKEIGVLYLSIATKLMTVPPPSAIAPAHVRLANAYAALGSITLDLAKMGEDPLLALVALERYDDARKELREALGAYAKALRSATGTTP